MDNQLVELLGQLCSQLLSTDNNTRKQAEEQLEKHWLVNQPGQLLMGLTQLLLSHPDPNLREFCSVLFRRYSLKQVPVNNNSQALLELTGPQVLAHVQQQLLQALSTEQESRVRNKIADATSQLATFLVSHKAQWNELYQLCGEFISSSNHIFRSSAFNVLLGCPSLLFKYDQNQVKSMFVAGLQDQDVDVRLTALKATVNYISIAKPAIRSGLQDLVPLILNVIPPVMADSAKELEAVDGLTHIIDLAAIHPKMFKPVLPQCVEYMIHQMKNVELEDGTRQTCLELLMTLTEGAPGLMRKHETFASSIIPVLLEWMSELEDEQEWYQGENIEDVDESANETVGEQAMDRLAIYLTGKIVLPIAFQLIPNMLSSPEWNRRHAALRCISAIGEGCLKIMKAELGKVVQLVLPHMRDPHPRVRHAACNSIGQMCTDFSPRIQEQYHEPILTHLIPIMDDLQHIRVANYAAAALVNFSENCSNDVIAPYIETIIGKLLVLMQSGKIFVQEQCITTLATVADSAGASFATFYPQVMPVLFQILSLENHKELRTLKGKTLECSSLIILAVGKEVFAPDAMNFLSALKQIQDSIVDPDDPQASYLLSAWARVGKVMGTDFAPYLEVVLPPLLKTAESAPKMVAYDADTDAGDQYTEEEGWEIMAVGDKNLAIKTSALEDKSTAVEMILCYAQEMGPIFHPYVEHVIRIVSPLLKFYLNDGVRYAAASVIPILIECWIKAEYPHEKIVALWQSCCVSLLEACKEEEDMGVVSALYNAMGDSIKALGVNSMIPEHLQAFTLDIVGQLEQYLIRNLERQKLRESPDYEPEDEEALQDEEYSDDQFLADVSSVISTLFKTFGVNFLPFFEQMLGKIAEFMNNPDPSSRQWALCIFCDLIEFTGSVSLNYQQHFLQQMAHSLSDSSADVRQSASYGVGIAAKFGGPTYVDFCIASLPHLVNIINSPEARNEENLMATENAVSALGKIIRVYKDSGRFDTNGVLAVFLKGLPITEDSEEAPDTYSLLLEFIEMQHPAIVTPAEIPRLVNVLTSVLVIPSLLAKNPELLQRMTSCLHSILGGCDGTMKVQIWQLLGDEQRQYLTSSKLV